MEEAESSLRRSLEIFPLNVKAFRNLGEALKGQLRYEEALKWYGAATRVEPEEPLNHAGIGAVFFWMERYPEAVSSIKHALELQPDFETAPALFSLIAQALRKMGLHGEADRYFDLSVKRGMEANPPDPGVLFSRAEDLRGRKRHQESLRWYQDAIKVAPDFALVYAGMGDSLYRLGRYAEAVSSMKRVFELMPDFPMAPTLHYLTGQALGEMGRYDEAEEQYERALRIAPSFKEAINGLAGLLLVQKRYEEALDRYRTLAQIEPENAATHSQIGIALFKIGRVEEALGSFDRALSLDPTLESARNYREQARKSMTQEGRRPE